MHFTMTQPGAHPAPEMGTGPRDLSSHIPSLITVYLRVPVVLERLYHKMPKEKEKNDGKQNFAVVWQN